MPVWSLQHANLFQWQLTYEQRICTGEIRKKAAQVIRFTCNTTCDVLSINFDAALAAERLHRSCPCAAAALIGSLRWQKQLPSYVNTVCPGRA